MNQINVIKKSATINRYMKTFNGTHEKQITYMRLIGFSFFKN
jgi:hypothetical protein